MSHQTWTCLGKPTCELNTKFVNIRANTFEKCIGALHLSLSINSHSECAKFFVIALGYLEEEVVLSRH